MERLKSCHCCGLIQRAPEGLRLMCARCETSLEGWWRRLGGNHWTLALALAAIVLYVPAMTLPFLRIERLGHAHESNLPAGVRALYIQGHWLVATVVLVFSIVTPVVKLGLLLLLSQRRWRLPERSRAATYRLVEHLGRWGMLDVLLVAVLVAFVKLGGLVEFRAGGGLAIFASFVLCSLLASAAFDPYWLWDEGIPLATSSAGVGTGDDAVAPVGPVAMSTPLARSVVPRRGLRWLWLLPCGAAVLAGWLLWTSLAERGRVITVTFRDGHGVVAGADLRYRGIVCGTVEAARLADDLSAVEFDVRLAPAAEPLARAGARFWIVRPQFDLGGATGLETVIGPNYLALLPGDPQSEPAARFLGLEEPPVPDLEEPGGVDVVLQSAQGSGLRVGQGVYFRDIRIGGIVSSGLAGDGSAIETRIYVRPQFRHLIRTGSVFWNAGGVHLRGGLTGFALHVGTAETLLRGGIGLAVRPDPGEEVAAGHRFKLHPAPEAEWFDWQPAVAGGVAPASAARPSMLPVVLRWTHDGFFRDTPRERFGCVLVSAAEITGPADLLTVPAGALNGEATVFLGPTGLRLPAAPASTNSGLSSLALSEQAREALAGSARQATVRRAQVPEDLFLIGGDEAPPLFVAAVRCEARPDAGEWSIDRSLPLAPHLHGAAAAAASDGALLGRLLLRDTGAVLLLAADGDGAP